LHEPQSREVSGVGDPRLRFSVNFLGAPALSLAEFRNYQQDLILGANFEVTAPFGQYNPDKLLNIGTNRRSGKTQFGASKALGSATIEASLAATFFFTNNTDFLGGKTLEQDPLYAAQGHLIYEFAPWLWGTLDGTYYTGRRTTIDGEPGKRLENSASAEIIDGGQSQRVVQALRQHWCLQPHRASFDRVGIGWQFRWGGRL
jgi:hypothetical protein